MGNENSTNRPAGMGMGQPMRPMQMGAPAAMPGRMQTMGAMPMRPPGGEFPGQANGGQFPGQGRGVEGGFPGQGGPMMPRRSEPMPMPQMQGDFPGRSQGPITLGGFPANGGFRGDIRGPDGMNAQPPRVGPEFSRDSVANPGMNRDPRGIPAFDRPAFPGQGGGVEGGFPGQGDFPRRSEPMPMPGGDFGPQAFGVPGGTGPMLPQDAMANRQMNDRPNWSGLSPEVMQLIMGGWRGNNS